MKNTEFETYVTFTDNRSAALAFTFTVSENTLLNKHLEHKKWFVEPANTWHQPLESSVTSDLQNGNAMDVDNVDDQMLPPILQLNDDCFHHLFKFCDLESLINLSQACKTFNTLLGEKGSTKQTFRQFHTLSVYVNDLSDEEYTTLGIARRHLMRTGKHVKKLVFEFDDSSRSMNLRRYLEKFNQYVGENVRELVINDVCFSDDNLPLLKPILKRLHVLKINNLWSPVRHTIDLETLCPNLMNLKLCKTIKIKSRLGTWPKLKNLKILSIEDDIEDEDVYKLIKNNQHLEGLKIQLKTLYNLQNLTKLTIFNYPEQVSTTQFNILSRPKLTHLTISHLSRNNFDAILGYVAGFAMLRALKLHVDSDHIPKDFVFNQRVITDLVQNLPNLEKLFLLNISLNASTVVDAIRFGTKLETFHFHNCGDVQLTESVIREIVNERKSKPHEKLLTLFVDGTVYWETLLDNEGKRYLRLDFGCEHSRFNW